jgi:hypothetical protein
MPSLFPLAPIPRQDLFYLPVLHLLKKNIFVSLSCWRDLKALIAALRYKSISYSRNWMCMGSVSWWGVNLIKIYAGYICKCHNVSFLYNYYMLINKKKCKLVFANLENEHGQKFG